MRYLFAIELGRSYVICMRNLPFRPSHFHYSGSVTTAVTLPADAGLPPDSFDELPTEIIPQILKSFYPPAAFRPFDHSTICQEETSLPERLNDPHKSRPRDARRERLVDAYTGLSAIQTPCCCHPKRHSKSDFV